MTGLQNCSKVDSSDSRLIGGFRSFANTYGVSAIDQNGQSLWKLESPARVHGLSVSQEARLAAVASRRPGYFIQLFDPLDGTVLQQIDCPDNSFLEGHVEILGNRLWATAAKNDSCDGLLYSWDLQNLDKAPDRLELAGLGPHQLTRNKDSELWIAMGGWKTKNRETLNADNFESYLLRLNSNDGSIKTFENPTEELSLRHLAIQGEEVFVAAQYADPKPSSQPLIYRFAENRWTALEAPEMGWDIFKGYIASIAVSAEKILATSPQGHHLGLWQRNDLSHLQTQSALDVAGALNLKDQLSASSGVGKVFHFNSDKSATETEFHWDNHWVAYSPG